MAGNKPEFGGEDLAKVARIQGEQAEARAQGPNGDEKYRMDVIHGPNGEKMEVRVPRNMAIRDQLGSIIQGGWW